MFNIFFSVGTPLVKGTNSVVTIKTKSVTSTAIPVTVHPVTTASGGKGQSISRLCPSYPLYFIIYGGLYFLNPILDFGVLLGYITVDNHPYQCCALWVYNRGSTVRYPLFSNPIPSLGTCGAVISHSSAMEQ